MSRPLWRRRLVAFGGECNGNLAEPVADGNPLIDKDMRGGVNPGAEPRWRLILQLNCKCRLHPEAQLQLAPVHFILR
jgi:hypothetical protein